MIARACGAMASRHRRGQTPHRRHRRCRRLPSHLLCRVATSPIVVARHTIAKVRPHGAPTPMMATRGSTRPSSGTRTARTVPAPRASFAVESGVRASNCRRHRRSRRHLPVRRRRRQRLPRRRRRLRALPLTIGTAAATRPPVVAQSRHAMTRRRGAPCARPLLVACSNRSGTTRAIVVRAPPRASAIAVGCIARGRRYHNRRPRRPRRRHCPPRRPVNGRGSRGMPLVVSRTALERTQPMLEVSACQP